MPNMNGLQAAKVILAANKHQRIIFASAYAKTTIEKSVIELHAVVEILQKPFDVQVLINLVENKSVHEELKKINSRLSKQDQIQLGQLREMLNGLKKLKVDTPLLS
jgi:response regulator RpfG family c-di-GMP phosphodiesterase